MVRRLLGAVVAGLLLFSRAPAKAQHVPLVAEKWAHLVERHDPGKVDAPLVDLGGWDDRALVQVLAGLRALFRQYADPARQNRLLLAGAVAHADLAILSPALAARVVTLYPLQPPRLAVRGLDGEHQATDRTTAHWEFAHVLLDRVTPAPAASAGVRLWYRAMGAYFISDLRLAEATPHLERGRSIFPDDAVLLLLSGAMHETFASPLYQVLRKDVQRRTRGRHDPRAGPRAFEWDRPADEAAELDRAERYLRAALAADPQLVEARIRLGRVLGRHGRRREAAGELNAALSQATEPLLRYYAELFLGAEEDALGRPDVARSCFERAAALFETAQSPRIALSDLARRAGDSAGVRRTLRSVAALSPDAGQREDPWWEYDRSAGRGYVELMDQLRGLVRSGDRDHAGR